LFQNAPVAIQLVGQTLEDEAVIGMGEIVDAAVRAHLNQDDSPVKL
jgi:amidase